MRGPRDELLEPLPLAMLAWQWVTDRLNGHCLATFIFCNFLLTSNSSFVQAIFPWQFVFT